MVAERAGCPANRFALEVGKVDARARIRRRRLEVWHSKNDGGDPRRLAMLIGSLGVTHLDLGGAGGRRSQRHPDPQRLLVLGEPDFQQPVDQVNGHRRRANLPAANRPPPLPHMRANLVSHTRELLGRKSKTLSDVPSRMVATTKPQHIAVRDDPLMSSPKRHMRVRVLG